MRQVVLLRHGESLWNKENRFTGWTDVPLTERECKKRSTPAVCFASRDTPSTNVGKAIFPARLSAYGATSR